MRDQFRTTKTLFKVGALSSLGHSLGRSFVLVLAGIHLTAFVLARPASSGPQLGFKMRQVARRAPVNGSVNRSGAHKVTRCTECRLALSYSSEKTHHQRTSQPQARGDHYSCLSSDYGMGNDR